MGPEERRSRLAAARVGRLGTVSADGEPHVVPVVFAVVGDVLYTAVDAKPKTTRRPAPAGRRQATGRACCWWTSTTRTGPPCGGCAWTAPRRCSGPGSTQERQAVVALVAKYPQYAGAAPAGPVIALRIRQWRSWAYDDH